MAWGNMCYLTCLPAPIVTSRGLVCMPQSEGNIQQYPPTIYVTLWNFWLFRDLWKVVLHLSLITYVMWWPMSSCPLVIYLAICCQQWTNIPPICRNFNFFMDLELHVQLLYCQSQVRFKYYCIFIWWHIHLLLLFKIFDFMWCHIHSCMLFFQVNGPCHICLSIKYKFVWKKIIMNI